MIRRATTNWINRNLCGAVFNAEVAEENFKKAVKELMKKILSMSSALK